jgi:hypothetical protein
MIKKFDQFVNEIYNKYNNNWISINESQESKSQSAAVKLLMDKLGWDKQKADKFVRDDLRNDITPLRDKNIAKFTLGVTRMYIDGELKSAAIISNLNATLKLLLPHINEYDRNLNGLSADELISSFERTRQNNISQEKEEISKMKFGVSDYDIVKINSYKDAKKYYKYTNPSSRWCLTHMEDMFDNYTCNGTNQVYFCLRKGFEDIKPIVGENAPLDDYGLSMLSIIINVEGELAYCTCRWNHDNGGNDSVMNAPEISKVVNVDFYETFKPNTKWKDMVDDIRNKLKNGESPKDLFDSVEDFRNEFAIVRLNGKYNFINTDGEIISDKWFESVENFNNGWAKVQLNKKWNLINTDGKIASNEWFDKVSNFEEDGYARVELNKKWNLINTDGKIAFNEWYDSVVNFRKEWAKVELNNKFNFINIDGKYISDEWFDACYSFTNKNDYTIVKLNGKVNFINTDGEYISDEWFDRVDDFIDGWARVRLDTKWNFINTDGEIIYNEWFDDAIEFENGFAKIVLNNKGNLINTDGEIIFDKWFDDGDELDDAFDSYISKMSHK